VKVKNNIWTKLLIHFLLMIPCGCQVTRIELSKLLMKQLLAKRAFACSNLAEEMDKKGITK